MEILSQSSGNQNSVYRILKFQFVFGIFLNFKDFSTSPDRQPFWALLSTNQPPKTMKSKLRTNLTLFDFEESSIHLIEFAEWERKTKTRNVKLPPMSMVTHCKLPVMERALHRNRRQRNLRLLKLALFVPFSLPSVRVF